MKKYGKLCFAVAMLCLMSSVVGSSAFAVDDVFLQVKEMLNPSSACGSVCDEEGHFSDSIGDVVDINGEIIEHTYRIDIEDIDVAELWYEITDSTVELSLSVYGQILNRGSFDELDLLYGEWDPNQDIIDIDSTLYEFLIETENNLYQVRYVNGEVEVTDAYYEVNVTDASALVNDETLRISFSLDTSDDELVGIQAASLYLYFNFNLSDPPNMTEDEFMFIAFDTIPNDPLEIYYAECEYSTIPQYKSVRFEGMVVPMTGQPPYTYEWDFGDGQTQIGPSVSHRYVELGEYVFTLTVTDGAGDSCSQDGSVNVVAEPCVDFWWSPEICRFGEVVCFDSEVYNFDGCVETYSWRYGDGHWGYGQNSSHVFNRPGIFTVSLIAEDEHGIKLFQEREIEIVNEAPLIPTRPQGTESGSINVTYSYSTSTSDPEGDGIYYRWDFGDGNCSEWLGPYAAGEECLVEYCWLCKGDYEVRVCAKDVYGYYSKWSEPLPVNMPVEIVRPWWNLLLDFVDWFLALFGNF